MYSRKIDAAKKAQSWSTVFENLFLYQKKCVPVMQLRVYAVCSGVWVRFN